MMLVDYDGLFVPSMEGMKSLEVGLPNYQHPSRDYSYFGPQIDNFSAMVILIQLMIVNKKLWEDLHSDDSRLMLGKKDFCNPDESF